MRHTSVFAAWVAGLYYLAYVVYLALHQEGELLHWLSLVAVPLIILTVLFWKYLPAKGWAYPLQLVGLRRGNLANLLWLAALTGLALSVLQLWLSRYWAEVQPLFASGKWVYLLPLSFCLMLLTAGFTEEFFFRGFLLGRLLDARMQTWLAVLCSAVAFTLYHLPYAYFNPNWPSAGDFPAALGQSFVEAFPIGIVLSLFFIWSRRNLLACALLHALINTLPAMALIKLGG